eukprot:g2811.t1
MHVLEVALSDETLSIIRTEPSKHPELKWEQPWLQPFSDDPSPTIVLETIPFFEHIHVNDDDTIDDDDDNTTSQQRMCPRSRRRCLMTSEDWSVFEGDGKISSRCDEIYGIGSSTSCPKRGTRVESLTNAFFCLRSTTTSLFDGLPSSIYSCNARAGSLRNEHTYASLPPPIFTAKEIKDAADASRAAWLGVLRQSSEFMRVEVGDTLDLECASSPRKDQVLSVELLRTIFRTTQQHDGQEVSATVGSFGLGHPAYCALTKLPQPCIVVIDGSKTKKRTCAIDRSTIDACFAAMFNTRRVMSHEQRATAIAMTLPSLCADTGNLGDNVRVSRKRDSNVSEDDTMPMQTRAIVCTEIERLCRFEKQVSSSNDEPSPIDTERNDPVVADRPVAHTFEKRPVVDDDIEANDDDDEVLLCDFVRLQYGHAHDVATNAVVEKSAVVCASVDGINGWIRSIESWAVPCVVALAKRGIIRVTGDEGPIGVFRRRDAMRDFHDIFVGVSDDSALSAIATDLFLLRKLWSIATSTQLDTKMRLDKIRSVLRRALENAEVRRSLSDGTRSHLFGMLRRESATSLGLDGNTIERNGRERPLLASFGLFRYEAVRVLASETFVKNIDIVHTARERFNIHLFDRSAVRFPIDVVVDERCGVSVLDARLSAQDVACWSQQMLNIVESFERIWILLVLSHQGQPPRASALSCESVLTPSFVEDMLSGASLVARSAEFSIVPCPSNDTNAVAGTLRRIVDDARGLSKIWSPSDYADREWMENEETEAERFLSAAVPTMNAFCAASVATTTSLREFARMSQDQMADAFWWIPRNIIATDSEQHVTNPKRGFAMPIPAKDRKRPEEAAG